MKAAEQQAAMNLWAQAGDAVPTSLYRQGEIDGGGNGAQGQRAGELNDTVRQAVKEFRGAQDTARQVVKEGRQVVKEKRQKSDATQQAVKSSGAQEKTHEGERTTGVEGQGPRDFCYSWRERMAADSLAKVEAATHAATRQSEHRVDGEPLPYRFRNDSYVTLALLLSVVMMVWVVTRSGAYFMKSVREALKPSGATWSAKTNSEMRGQVFMVLETCFTLGVLTFYYVQTHLPRIFAATSPYEVLLFTSGLFAAYILVKMGMYAAVNAIFFDHRTVRAWNEIFLLYLLLIGVGMLPVVLLAVYFDASYEIITALSIGVLVLGKIFLVLKSHAIFIRSKFNFLHNILYLCALEIVPPLVLWRSLIYSLHLLTAID